MPSRRDRRRMATAAVMVTLLLVNQGAPTPLCSQAEKRALCLPASDILRPGTSLRQSIAALGACLEASVPKVVRVAEIKSTAAQAAKDFTQSMSASMKSILGVFDLQGGGLPAAADAVVQVLEDMEDPFFHYGRAQHGFSFACIVWPFEIRADFASHDILKYGTGDKYIGPTAHIKAANGAVPFDICRSPPRPTVEKLGLLGWPCSTGGAVRATYLAQGNTHYNVMAFFYPTAAELQDSPKKRLWLKNALGTCVSKPLFAAWALSEIAACLYKTDLKNPTNTEKKVKIHNRAHGVAVFPIYRCTGSKAERGESFGLSAEEGRLLLDEVKVTSGSSGSPLDQLCIASVALLPFGKI